METARFSAGSGSDKVLNAPNERETLKKKITDMKVTDMKTKIKMHTAVQFLHLREDFN